MLGQGEGAQQVDGIVQAADGGHGEHRHQGDGQLQSGGDQQPVGLAVDHGGDGVGADRQPEQEGAEDEVEGVRCGLEEDGQDARPDDLVGERGHPGDEEGRQQPAHGRRREPGAALRGPATGAEGLGDRRRGRPAPGDQVEHMAATPTAALSATAVAVVPRTPMVPMSTKRGEVGPQDAAGGVAGVEQADARAQGGAAPERGAHHDGQGHAHQGRRHQQDDAGQDEADERDEGQVLRQGRVERAVDGIEQRRRRRASAGRLPAMASSISP